MSNTARILCFSPNARWTCHSAYEVMIMHALRVRGARTKMVLCDGVFGECDVFQPAKNPRQFDSCLHCQAAVAASFSRWRMDYTWISRHLPADFPETARTWARQLPADELDDAHYNGLALGLIIASSLTAGFRDAQPDRNDPVIGNYERELLAGALITLVAMEQIIKQFRPTAMFLFNGRMAYTRAALEIARKNNIPVLVHERGNAGAQLQLSQNEPGFSMATTEDIFEVWRDTPLSDDEFTFCAELLHKRMNGGGFSRAGYSAIPYEGADIRQSLNIRADAPLVVAFTSSPDECMSHYVGTPEIPSPWSWVEAVTAYAVANPGVQIILRVHPNVGSATSNGKNEKEMAYFRHIATVIPPNVLLIPSTVDVNAYMLMRAADAVTTWASSTSLESAMLGRPVVQAGGLPGARDLPYLHRLKPGESFAAGLDTALQPRSVEETLRTTILAWRFGYIQFKRRMIDQPLIRHDEWHTGDFNFNTTEALKPGMEPGLDRVCDILLNRASLIPSKDGHVSDVSRERAAVRRFLDDFGWARHTPVVEQAAAS